MPLPSSPRPKVSVAMITYNHEKCIAQAIESVLMQETTFPIELVIGEDYSTDNTREIVKRYAALRPDVIQPLLHERNVGMRGNGDAVLEACRGQYIACLEGDDYWTSPQKLQRQVDFLDQHPDYSICGHRFMNVFSDHPEWPPSASPVQKESGTLRDILRWNYLLTCTVMYRAGLVTGIPTPFKRLRHGWHSAGGSASSMRSWVPTDCTGGACGSERRLTPKSQPWKKPLTQFMITWAMIIPGYGGFHYASATWNLRINAWETKTLARPGASC